MFWGYQCVLEWPRLLHRCIESANRGSAQERCQDLGGIGNDLKCAAHNRGVGDGLQGVDSARVGQHLLLKAFHNWRSRICDGLHLHSSNARLFSHKQECHSNQRIFYGTFCAHSC